MGPGLGSAVRWLGINIRSASLAHPGVVAQFPRECQERRVLCRPWRVAS